MRTNPLVKQGWLRGVIAVLVFTPVITYSINVLRLLSNMLDVDFNRLCVVTNSLIVALLAVYLTRRFIDRKSFVSMGYSIHGFWKDIVLGFIASFAVISMGVLILFLLGNIEITSLNCDIASMMYWATILLFSAALEEATFRGYMLNNMMESMKSYYAVGIVSVVFGIGHVSGQNISVIGILNCIILGCLVGSYYVHKQNIWAPIAFHMGWNFFQGIIFGFSVSGRSFSYSLLNTQISGNELITGGKVGFEGSLILTMLTVSTMLLFEMNLWKRKS